jgi:hypothetical protein
MGDQHQQLRIDCSHMPYSNGQCTGLTIYNLLLLSRLYCMYLCPLQSLNYAPIAVGVVLLVSGGWWVCGARKWSDRLCMHVSSSSRSSKPLLAPNTLQHQQRPSQALISPPDFDL